MQTLGSVAVRVCRRECGADVSARRHFCDPCLKLRQQERSREEYRRNKATYQVWGKRRWKESPRPDRREYRKTYYEKNKERIKAGAAEYNKKYPGKTTRWRRANPEKSALKSKQYKQNRKARERGVLGSFSSREWEAVIIKQSGMCARCERRCKLTVDHIVPLAKGGCNYIFNIQGLCRSCNCSKHADLPPGTPLSLFDKPFFHKRADQ